MAANTTPLTGKRKTLGAAAVGTRGPLLPGLNDDTALRILALLPPYLYSTLARLSRAFGRLIIHEHSVALQTLRRQSGIVDHLLLFIAAEQVVILDLGRRTWIRLPVSAGVSRCLAPCRAFSVAGAGLITLFPFSFKDYHIGGGLLCYDMATGRFSTTAPMLEPSRRAFAMAADSNGWFVAGGSASSGLNKGRFWCSSAEKYDPINSSWESLPPMPAPRVDAKGFLMANKFYVLGGLGASHQWLFTAEEYDPSSRTWRTIHNMAYCMKCVACFHCPHSYPFSSFSYVQCSYPLVAVANDQLYWLCTHHDEGFPMIHVYENESNTWQSIRWLPYEALFHRFLKEPSFQGFYSADDRLFLIHRTPKEYVVLSWQPANVPNYEIFSLENVQRQEM